MDDDLRAAERAWRAAPEDARAHERWIEARLRAGIAVDHEELDRRLHPAREWTLPVPAALYIQRPEGGEWRGDALPGQPLAVPAGRGLGVIPALDTTTSLDALTAAGFPIGTTLSLSLAGAGAADALLPALARASWTHLRLSSLPAPCDAQLQRVAELPRLTSLNLSRLGGDARHTVFTARDLRPLARAPHLTALELYMTGLEPGALAAPAGPGLRALAVSEIHFAGGVPQRHPADAELGELVRAAPGLRALDLQAAFRHLGDPGLRALAAARDLSVLRLPDCPRLTDAGLAALAGLPLRDLVLSAPGITDASAPTLTGLPLERLELRAPELSAEALAGVVTRPAHLALRLDRPAQLPGLREAGPRLRELDLNLDPAGAASDVRLLRTFTGLHELYLRFPDTHDDAALWQLRDCRSLHSLRLWDVSALGEETARHLCTLPLRRLDLSGRIDRVGAGAHVGSAALRALAAHPTLRRLSLSWCAALTDEVLLAFASTPRLEALDVWGCDAITAAGAERLRALAGGRLELNVTPAVT